jgi:hypothetical protein
VLSPINAHVWKEPVLTMTAVDAGISPVMFCANTGIGLLMAELLPNWPLPLLPQHVTLPFAITAHE